MAKRRGNRGGSRRGRAGSPKECCPRGALLCPERYSDALLRETAMRLNAILALCRARRFQAISFVLDLWRTMARMTLKDVLYGRPPEDPRRA